MLTEEILRMLFDEYGSEDLNFDVWADENDYDPSMTDREIYNLLPKELLPFLGEFGLNASWYHDGL